MGWLQGLFPLLIEIAKWWFNAPQREREKFAKGLPDHLRQISESEQNASDDLDPSKLHRDRLGN